MRSSAISMPSSPAAASVHRASVSAQADLDRVVQDLLFRQGIFAKVFPHTFRQIISATASSTRTNIRLDLSHCFRLIQNQTSYKN